MHVTGRDTELSVLVGHLHNLFIQILQVTLTRDLRELFIVNQKLIVPDRLNLIIIIKIADSAKLFRRLFGDEGAEQLTLFTGGTDNDALTVFPKKALRNSRSRPRKAALR